MFAHVHAASGVPIYFPIESQVKHAVAAEAGKQGDALPSVRKLASDLRFNPNAAARAYQDLERDGVIGTLPGGRNYVAENVAGPLNVEKVKRLRPVAMQLAVEGGHLRLSPHDILNRRGNRSTSWEERKGPNRRSQRWTVENLVRLFGAVLPKRPAGKMPSTD